jgi:hypothetical protein
MPQLANKFVLTMAAFLVVAGSAFADFGAIAYSPETGSWAYSYGFCNQRTAEDDALHRCDGTDAEIVVWVENGWAALAVGDDGAYGWGWSGSSRADAESRALSRAGDNAHIVCWLSSGR